MYVFNIYLRKQNKPQISRIYIQKEANRRINRPCNATSFHECHILSQFNQENTAAPRQNCRV